MSLQCITQNSTRDKSGNDVNKAVFHYVEFSLFVSSQTELIEKRQRKIVLRAGNSA